MDAGEGRGEGQARKAASVGERNSTYGRKEGNKKDGKTITLAREKRKKDRKIYLIRWKEGRQATRDERQIDSFII